jgi:hypothetical protein
MGIQDTNISELLRQVDNVQLREFLIQYAKKHPAFKNEIIRHFNPEKQQKSLDDYRQDALDSFESPGHNTKGHDYYEAANQTVENLYAMLRKARDLTFQKEFKQATAIAQSLIEAIPRKYEMTDDSSGEISEIFTGSVDLLGAILQFENIDKDLAGKIFHWLKGQMNEQVYHYHGFYELDSLFVPCAEAAGLVDDALDIINHRIKNADSSYQLEMEVKEKIQLLQIQGKTQEVENTIGKYIGLPGIRKLRIQDLLEKDKPFDAISLIKDAIIEAGKQDNRSLMTDLKEQLLDIYQGLNDHKNVVRYAEDLFSMGHGIMKYYRILKGETDPGEWPDRLDALIKGYEGGSGNLPKNVLAQVFIEEEYWDRLLQMMEKLELWEMDAYEKYLKPIYPTELLSLYEQKVSRYAEINESRNHCQYVASILGKMRTYPEGDLVVDRLLAEFRLIYKDRGIMMEELKNV